MPMYEYTVVDGYGKKIAATMIAASGEDLERMLSNEGLYPLSVKRKPQLGELVQQLPSSVRNKWDENVIFFNCPCCHRVQMLELQQYTDFMQREEEKLLFHRLASKYAQKGGVYHTCNTCSAKVPLCILNLPDSMGWCFECDRLEEMAVKSDEYIPTNCSVCNETLQGWVNITGQEILDAIHKDITHIVQKLDPEQRFTSSACSFWYQYSVGHDTLQTTPRKGSGRWFRKVFGNYLVLFLCVTVKNEWHFQHYQLRLQAAQEMIEMWRECVLKAILTLNEFTIEKYLAPLYSDATNFKIFFRLEDQKGNVVGGCFKDALDPIAPGDVYVATY